MQKHLSRHTNLQSPPHSWREPFPPSTSNFYPAPIVIEGATYATSEHYYQSRKFTHNLAIRALILAAPTPAESFALAHAHEGDVVADWHTHHKKRDMFRAVIFKFKQHPQLQVGGGTHSRIKRFFCLTSLQQQLIATGSRPIVEASAVDAFWGEGADGSGLNVLGHMLMNIRSTAFCNNVKPLTTKYKL